MADKYPLADGNWSNSANWNDGTKPVAGDNVYADGKIVTIDEDATCAKVSTETRSGGTAGGGFTLAAGVTLTANVIAGATTPCVTRNAAGADSYVVGNVSGGGTYAHGVNNASTGTISITGDVRGGSGFYSYGVNNTSTGTISITGDVRGGSGSNSYGVYNASTGTISITGDVSAGTSESSHGVYSITLGHIRLAGNQVCSVSGAAVGTQAVCVKKLAMSDGDNTTTAYAEAGDLLGTYSGETVSHYGLLVGPFGHPATADVRDGTVYGPSAELEGTLAVPAAGSVALGVPVDDTEGTAVLTQAAVEAAAAAAIADAGLATSAQVAALSVIPTASVSETPTAGTIAIRRGDYLSQAISGVGDISARTYLWFTAKTAPSRQADSAARIQITEAGGLVILNGEAYATAADGDLTVDESAETVTIVLSAEVTAALSAGQRMEWDIQILDATGNPRTIATGTLTVTADVTRATEEPT